MKIFVGGILPRHHRFVLRAFPGVEFTFADCCETETQWGRLAGSSDVSVCNIKFANHGHEMAVQRVSPRYIRYKGGTTGLIDVLRTVITGGTVRSH